jgi:hypothetical protein
VKDIILVALIVLSFAWIVTMHVWLVLGLAQRKPRWRALVALFLVLPAPFWAWQERMRRRVWLWGAGVVVYSATLLLSHLI